MHKYIKVQGIKGVLVAVSSGARAYVAQETLAMKLDPETQQIIPWEEAVDGFKPTTVCVVMHRAYMKAIRKGQLKLYGAPTAAKDAPAAEEALKDAKLHTPTGKKWTKNKAGRELLVADLKPSKGDAPGNKARRKGRAKASAAGAGAKGEK